MRKVFYVIALLLMMYKPTPMADGQSNVHKVTSIPEKSIDLKEKILDHKDDTLADVVNAAAKKLSEKPQVVYRTKWKQAKPDTVYIVVLPDSLNPNIPDIKDYFTDIDDLPAPVIVHDTVTIYKEIPKKNLIQKFKNLFSKHKN